MRISPEGGDVPFPGLDKKRLALDTEADPLGLSKVGAGEGWWAEGAFGCMCGWWGGGVEEGG